MPSGYAHYRFGAQLLPTLPREVRQVIDRHRSLYDVGLHGPDLFLYYDPARKNRIALLSDHYHGMTGQVLFSRVCKRLRLEPAEPALAYLYGLLGHYCLDALCHPFVFQHTRDGLVGHLALETEFDRYLLDLDGKRPPHTQDCSRHIRLTRGECMTVARFFPPATGANISRCIKGMTFSLRLLGNANRSRTEKLISRFAPGHMSHLVPGEEVADYAYMIGELLELFDQALVRYPLLLQQLQQQRKEGTPLDDVFAPDFG